MYAVPNNADFCSSDGIVIVVADGGGGGSDKKLTGYGHEELQEALCGSLCRADLDSL